MLYVKADAALTAHRTRNFLLDHHVVIFGTLDVHEVAPRNACLVHAPGTVLGVLRAGEGEDVLLKAARCRLGGGLVHITYIYKRS